MNEVTFYNQGGVTVTSARFMVPSQTYAMSGVTSVRASEVRPKRTGPILLFIFGALSLLLWFVATNDSTTFVICGLFFIGFGVNWWVNQKTQYYVSLVTAAGEQRALADEDEEYVRRVVAAINEAIVHRG